jgi:hypothetical protein
MNQEIAEVYEIEEFEQIGYCLLLEANEEYLTDDGIIVCFDEYIPDYIQNLAEYEEALDLAAEFFEPPYV